MVVIVPLRVPVCACRSGVKHPKKSRPKMTISSTRKGFCMLHSDCTHWLNPLSAVDYRRGARLDCVRFPCLCFHFTRVLFTLGHATTLIRDDSGRPLFCGTPLESMLPICCLDEFESV